MGAYTGICQTLARYALGMDEGEFALVEQCFTPDAVVQFPAPGGKRIAGRDDLMVEYRRRHARRGGQVRMLITNTVVLSETDDEAVAVSYVLSIWQDELDVYVPRTGWYRDTFVLDDETWLIRLRRVHSDSGPAASPFLTTD